MLTGELRGKIDAIWNDFWSGGLANPLQVIEQITYLIFIKRLDEMQEVDENGVEGVFEGADVVQLVDVLSEIERRTAA